MITLKNKLWSLVYHKFISEHKLMKLYIENKYNRYDDKGNSATDWSMVKFDRDQLPVHLKLVVETVSTSASMK